MSFDRVQIQTGGPGPLDGEFDDEVEVGRWDLGEFGEIEGDAEQGIDFHGSPGKQVLRDALEVT